MKNKSFDIKTVAKYALGYFILVEAVGILISLLILFTDYIRQSFPDMPVWILPIILSVISISTGVLVWRRLSQIDFLKYEFITIMTHKFRTPLTRIKWAVNDMASSVPLDKKSNIDAILESESQLLALTNTLVHLSASDVSRFDYHAVPMDMAKISEDLRAQYDARAKKKGITISFSSSPGMCVMADEEKIGFVFQILLDNAMSYTPDGGSISMNARPDTDGRHGIIEVSDTGIGMSRETASRVFRRFYRGENARHTDTEGMGIGLFMAKSMVEKQGGKISVQSEGESKGTTFSIHLPICRDVLAHN